MKAFEVREKMNKEKDIVTRLSYGICILLKYSLSDYTKELTRAFNTIIRCPHRIFNILEFAKECKVDPGILENFLTNIDINDGYIGLLEEKYFNEEIDYMEETFEEDDEERFNYRTTYDFDLDDIEDEINYAIGKIPEDFWTGKYED